MTNFTKQNIEVSGPYLSYQGKFIARCKENNVTRGHKRAFISFLIKNFTVEEYFAQMEMNVAPRVILEAKGYIMPHIKKWLKEGKVNQYKGMTAANI